MGFLRSLPFLVSTASLTHGGLVLNSFDQCNDRGECTKVKTPFRGVKRGDIWGPPIPGANKLACGTEQVGESSNHPGQRIVVPAGSEFGLRFSITRPGASKTGNVRLQMKYGETANFMMPNGWDVFTTDGNIDMDLDHTVAANNRTIGCTEDPEETDDRTCFAPYDLKFNMLEAGAGGFSGPATIQVEFVSDGETDLIAPPVAGTNGTLDPSVVGTQFSETQVMYYQCIDIEVTGGDALPDVGPWGYGDPNKDTGVLVRARSLVPKIEDDGINTLAIVLIVVVVLLFCCFICIWLKYKSNQEKQNEEKFPPQLAMAEKVQEAPAPVSQEKEPTPPPSEPEPEPEPEPPVEMEADRDLEAPPEKVEKNDGSSGRHYHFRYIDDDEQS